MKKKSVNFDEVDPKVKFPEQEEKILNFWKKEKIFEQSVANRSKNKKWTFLDGPPFITGLPHYGTLLSSIPKDIFPRYKTMQGYQVRRVWGWDCHGLPAENKVESKLGIKSKKEIEEKVGIKKFVEECKNYVSETSSEWEWYVDHIGRWVNFKNAYKTMDRDYMESVMWVFKSIYDKGYIYKGLRVSLYCPHCETPISNFEVAMDADNYKDLNENATTYKYQLEGDDNTYLLAWSTTPWNKIATPALAVNPKLDYVKVLQGNEKYILAKSTLKILKDSPKYKVLEEFKGTTLVGQKFVPHFDYYKNKIESGKNVFLVVPADYVTADEGTGIVTLAVYGEEDLVVMTKEKVHMEMHVTDNGIIKNDVPVFGGMYYMDANDQVDDLLSERGLIYKKELVTHTIPHCWRCGTRLFHNPQNAWFIDVQKLKEIMKTTNKDINWIPEHFKYGRFLKSMEAAPDWCISRSRYWGSPVPVWICDDCGDYFVPGSISELEKASGKKIVELHKPDIDEVIVKCKKCGGDAKRVPEVLDSWIEAGSASFAERHYPFEKNVLLDDFFPPDFIVEYTGQIRAWFYVLHVISAAIFKKKAFKNVVVTGVILGTDGRKMSKNFGNYPDPKEMLQKHGGDALRLYLMNSPVMKGEDIIISEIDYRSAIQGYLLPYWNIINFFVTYANLAGWKPSRQTLIRDNANNSLDTWIISRLLNVIKKITQAYEEYDTQSVIDLSRTFLVDDLSGWYVRRSRSRFSPVNTNDKDKKIAYVTLYTVLINFSKIIAPIVPFITDSVYRNLTADKSIHLTEWPKMDTKLADKELERDMSNIRLVVEKIHAERKLKGIAVRQPLSSVVISSPFRQISKELEEILLDEVNIKKAEWKKAKELYIKLDTTITKELEEEAKTRELIRKIQNERKNNGMSLKQSTKVIATWLPENEKLLTEIKEKTSTVELTKGNVFLIEKAS